MNAQHKFLTHISNRCCSAEHDAVYVASVLACLTGGSLFCSVQSCTSSRVEYLWQDAKHVMLLRVFVLHCSDLAETVMQSGALRVAQSASH